MIDPLLDLTAEIRTRAPGLPEEGVTQLLDCVEGYETASRMVRAGATRLGLSASVAVARGGRGSGPC